jgi:hypothetical protein
LGRRESGGGILHELGAHGKRQTAGGDQLGLEEEMEIEGCATAAMGEAIRAVASAEDEEASAVDGHHEVSPEAEGIQGFHSDEPPDTPGSQSGESMEADATEEVVESSVDGQGVLLGASEAIGIVQYVKLGIA